MGGGSTFTDTKDPLYIGGYPRELAKKFNIAYPQYVGCIRSIKINGRTEELASFTAYENVMFNVCPII